MQDPDLHAHSAAFDTVFDGVVVIEPHSRTITRANRAAAAIMGFDSPEAMIGVEPLASILEKDRRRARVYFNNLAAGQASGEGVEVRARDRKGREVWMLARGVALSANGCTMLLAAFRDITAQKRAQIALRQAQERQIELLNTSGELILITQDWQIVFVNRRLEEMTSASGRSVVGMSILDVVHPDHREAVRQGYPRVLDGAPTTPGRPLKGYSEAGEEAWGLARHVPFTWQGKPALLTVIQDVTERKRDEEALRQSEQKYRELAEKTNDIIWTADPGFRITYISPSVGRILGRTPAEVTGHPMGDFLSPASWEHLRAAMAGQLGLDTEGPGNREAVARTEAEFYRRDGSSVWLENLASGIRDRNGRLAGVYGISRDVTERRMAEEEARLAAQEWQETFDSAADMISVHDRDGHIVRANRAFAEALGLKQGEISGRHCYELVHGTSAPWPGCPHQRCLSLGRPCSEEIWEPRLGRYLQVSASPLFNSSHQVAGSVHMARDITERKKTEEALAASEANYRNLFDHSLMGLQVIDLETMKTVLASESMARMLGFDSGAAMQGTEFLDLVLPDDLDAVIAGLVKVLVSPGSYTSGTFRARTVDGRTVWVTAMASVFEYVCRLSILLSVLDVTAEKEAEDALRASESRYRMLADNVSDIIWSLNMKTGKSFFSPSITRLLGYTVEEVVSLRAREVVSPASYSRAMSAFSNAQPREADGPAPASLAAQLEIELVRKDGALVWVEVSETMVLDAGGRPAEVFGVMRDITGRKRADEALRSSEERFRNLVEATSDWVWETDPGGTYTYVSPQVSAALGYEAGEIIGRSIFDLMPAGEGPHFAATFRSAAAGSEPFSFVESPRLHKDGRVVVTETSGVPFFSDDGGLLGYRGIGRDITRRKKVERDLESSLRKVEKTMEAAIQTISYTMETRDPYTTGHQKRVTQLACAIAREMGLDQRQIDGIRVAGLLHDIGKIAVPTEILSKPGKLSEIEFSMIKAHPRVGFEILANVEFEWPIARIVVQHHERLNGTGYPFGIKGEEILLETRVLAVADVVEAMSSHRPYRPALGLQKALDELTRGEGTLYDPKVVKACGQVISERNFKFEG